MTILINVQHDPQRCNGIHADTKLTMFGIYSAAMNVAGIKFLWGYCLFSVVTIYKRVLWL